MRKLLCALAALAPLAIGIPTTASAGGVGVYVGGDRDYYGDRYHRGARAEFYRHDRGYHRGWHHRHRDRDVVIRRSWGG